MTRLAGMRALSVPQPWAFAIAAGHRPLDNRKRTTRYRGTLALHASLTSSPASYPTGTPTGRAAAQELQVLGGRGNCWDARVRPVGRRVPWNPLLAMGAIIALVDLVDVCAVRGGYTD